MKLEEEKISVIIPVFNVEKYLKRCVESVLNQTYYNLEILLIDDGSTDRSGIICEELKKDDSRIKVFHKRNAGVSSARNVGIKNATGKYLIFIDSDDRLEFTMIEILYNNLKKNNVDISVCEYYIEFENGKIERKQLEEEEKILTKEEFYVEILKDEFFGGYLFNKLIKKELVCCKNDIKLFEENIHICEDLVFICQIAQAMNKAYYTTVPYYYYLQRKGGALKNIYSKKQLSNFYAYIKIIEIYNNNSIPIDIKFQIKFFKFCIDALFLMRLYKISDKNFKEQVLKMKKKYYKKIKDNKNIKVQGKFKIMLSYYFPYIISRIKFVKRKIKGEF